MSKIRISKMSYHYEDYYYPVYESIDLTLKTEWKIGLIGRNGRGKTTLLRLLSGELEPTAGKIDIPVQVDYFPYSSECGYTVTRDVIKENMGGFKSMEDKMDQILIENDEARFEEYSNLQEQYQELGGYDIESDILRELNDMKLSPKLLDREFASLSGGEKTRIMLLTLFLRKNAFLLLDEPTNHLDEEGKEAVAQYLKKKSGFIVVSHDRVFLDQVIDHVVSINKKDITVEKGNYSTWKFNKEKKEEFELRTKERLEEEIAQLERSAKCSRMWANIGNAQKYGYASHGRANGVETYMKQAKRSESRIQENIEYKKELLKNYEEVNPLVIHQKTGMEAQWLVRMKELCFQYEEQETPIIKGFNYEIHVGDRIWIKGENGAGKSTLLTLLNGTMATEAIKYADGIKIAMVTQEPSWKSGYIADGFDEIVGNKKYQNFLELCEYFELPEGFLERPLETYSNGELRKVNIARSLTEENHILLLDEPLNYMDVYFREQLERAILNYKPTIVFVEHDKYFGNNIATRTITL